MAELAALSDADFLAEFESCRIGHTRWSHRCHVRMAYLYLREHGYDEGLRRIRDGIHALNASHGDAVPKDRVERGYHETITVAWARVLAAAIAAWGPATDFEAFAGQHPHLVQPTLLRLWYSRPHLMTWDAKRAFVEPDLAALPRMPR